MVEGIGVKEVAVSIILFVGLWAIFMLTSCGLVSAACQVVEPTGEIKDAIVPQVASVTLTRNSCSFSFSSLNQSSFVSYLRSQCRAIINGSSTNYLKFNKPIKMYFDCKIPAPSRGRDGRFTYTLYIPKKGIFRINNLSLRGRVTITVQ